MNYYSQWLLYILTMSIMALLWPSPLQAQDTTPLSGHLVGRDEQPVPAQVTIRITYPDSSSDSFDTASDGSFSFMALLEPGSYWLTVEYDSLPNVLKAVLSRDDLVPTAIMLPGAEPIRLNLFGNRNDAGSCEDVPLVFGTLTNAPVETYRQVIYTLLPLLEMDDLYYAEAYNPLSRSSLKINTVYVDRNQHAIVLLNGDFTQSEELCDDVYAREQIEQTVLSVPGIRSVTVLINDQLLDFLIGPIF